MPVNPAQQLDFMRFSSAEYLACFRRERDVLRAHTPDVPITTNFMATDVPAHGLLVVGSPRSTSSPTTTT